MKPRPIAHHLAHDMADLACEAEDWRTAVELLERCYRGDGPIGAASSLRTTNRLLNLRRRIEEDQVISMCIYGGTQAQLADRTGLSKDVVRRVVRRLVRRAMLHPTRAQSWDGRLETVYVLGGPETRPRP